jgi:two-component system, chemotaxis family, sensor kinase CheA
MATKNEEFQIRLLAMFRVEAEEHLDLITAGLLELEKTSAVERRTAVVESVFREVHSFKGAARSVNMSEVEALCQSMESIFALWKRGELEVSAELYDTLHRAVDGLKLLAAMSDENRAASPKGQIDRLSKQLTELLQGSSSGRQNPTNNGQTYSMAAPSEPLVAAAEERPASMETVRIATAKLDAVLLQAEELLSVKLATSQHAAELRDINAALARWKREWAKVQPEVRAMGRNLEENAQDAGGRNGRFTKITEFLDWSFQAFTELDGQMAAMAKSANQDHRTLGLMVDELLLDMKNVLMLPFSSVLHTFPGLVRELSRDQAKEVDLVIEGGEIEVDRRILEEIKDPLIHLIRNCIDHGIEKPAEREQKNKPRLGTIRIAVSQLDGNKVQVLISDNGRGIDRAKIKVSALKLGLIAQAEADGLSDPETFALVFRSGVSSSALITDLSGRGLGLAIVREKAEKLRGTITVDSQVHGGTTFRMVLPLTTATFRGIPVRVNQDFFVLPAATVERVARVKQEKIKTVENKDTIELDGKTISLVRLADVLELPRKDTTEDNHNGVPVVIISQHGKRIAFLVDNIVDEQEVLVKTLGRQLSRVRNIAGATVLANRKLVPILNVSDLMQSAVRVSGRTAQVPALEKDQPSRKSVLVVEDSITSRTLLKNILETAGYNVNTAVDGVDGFTQLRSREFDVVVSDVEMPRMNGFDLTAKIRADKKLSEMPIILVTALQSREDRERGMDAGANAYIVKNSFDQSNLLEVMGRLT